MNNWYVITGGPSVGKTTVLAELEKLGYTTLPEAARTIIDTALAEGKTIAELRADEKQFQADVLDHKLQVEQQHPKDLLTFFDRGMHDTAAYLKLHGFTLEKSIFDAMENSIYKCVFLLDPLDKYTLDYARTETADEVSRLNTLLYDMYTVYGMKPIKVPVLPPSQRAEFILSYI